MPTREDIHKGFDLLAAEMGGTVDHDALDRSLDSDLTAKAREIASGRDLTVAMRRELLSGTETWHPEAPATVAMFERMESFGLVYGTTSGAYRMTDLGREFARIRGCGRHLNVYSPGPLIIIRLPAPEPRWRAVLRALTDVMRSHGFRQKDISGIDAVGLEDADSNEGLARAFTGDPVPYAGFWLYVWRDDTFVKVRDGGGRE